nr:MAG TPA: hypothetical protein [Caudoviricetes sp.]
MYFPSHFGRAFFIAVITANLKNVYYNGNKKSPWARSLNYAGNEYEIEYVFF